MLRTYQVEIEDRSGRVIREVTVEAVTRKEAKRIAQFLCGRQERASHATHWE